MSLSMWAWRVVFPGGGLIACALVLWATIQGHAEPRARVSARRAPPRAQARVVAEGRVVARPGAEVTVGTGLGGLVVERPVREKARVKKGDLLVRLRSTDQEAAIAEAEAKLAEAEAEFDFQKREFPRRAKAPLDSQRFAAEVDASRRDYEIASARRKAAAAALEHGRSALSQTRITAPIDGVILECFIEPGEVAAPGARLVTVCDLSQTRVEAEVDEFDAQRISLGALVTVTAEGRDNDFWLGTVEEVPDRVSGRTRRGEKTT